MEWRIFLPKLSEVDTWIPDALKEQYSGKIDQLVTAFSVSEPESRVDRYLVGFQHFGIKYRGGERLEMKIRKKRSKNVPGAEIWEKKKLGTDLLASYLPKIEKHVGRFCGGHIVEVPRVANVDKIRYNNYRRGVHEEICIIRSIPGCCDREWLSLCVEGSEEDIASGLKSLQFIALYEALSLALLIIRTQRVNALSSKFYPILSGYPAWLNVLHSSTPEQSYDIIYEDCECLLSFVAFVDCNSP